MENPSLQCSHQELEDYHEITHLLKANAAKDEGTKNK